MLRMTHQISAKLFLALDRRHQLRNALISKYDSTVVQCRYALEPGHPTLKQLLSVWKVLYFFSPLWPKSCCFFSLVVVITFMGMTAGACGYTQLSLDADISLSEKPSQLVQAKLHSASA